MLRLRVLLLSGAMMVPCGAVQAETLDVLNAGFEDPVIANGEWIDADTPNYNWTLGYYDVAADPTLWVVGGVAGGIWNPDTGIGYPDGTAFAGENAGWAESSTGFDSGLSQVLTDTLQANMEYVLEVQAGNPLYNGSDETAPYRLELWAGDGLLQADTGASPLAGMWESHGLTYVSGSNPGQLGHPLEIRLISVDFADGDGVDGYEVDFDEVILTATPTSPFQVWIASSGPDLAFTWNSRAGKLYDILSSTDVSAPPAEWDVYEGNADIPASGTGANTLNDVPPSGAKRFFVVLEKDPPPPLRADFEDGADGWTTGLLDGFEATATAWELGMPSAGPGAAHGGNNAWGTDLDADYVPETGIFLRSPLVDLTDLPSATLEFWYFVDATEGEEGGRINLKETDGTLIEGAFGSFFWGQTPAWTLFSKRLPPEALGKEIILEFEFLSEGNSSTGSGWYIDDVEVHK